MVAFNYDSGLRRLRVVLYAFGLAAALLWLRVILWLSWDDFEYPKATRDEAGVYVALYSRAQEILKEASAGERVSSSDAQFIFQTLNDWGDYDDGLSPARRDVAVQAIVASFDRISASPENKEKATHYLAGFLKDGEEFFNRADKAAYPAYWADPTATGVAGLISRLDFRQDTNISTLEMQSAMQTLWLGVEEPFNKNLGDDENARSDVPALVYMHSFNQLHTVEGRRWEYATFWALCLLLPVVFICILIESMMWLLRGFLPSSTT
jgi:hypothetical protein